MEIQTGYTKHIIMSMLDRKSLCYKWYHQGSHDNSQSSGDCMLVKLESSWYCERITALNLHD